MTVKKEAAYPLELGGETGNAAAKSDSTTWDDITALTHRVWEVERWQDANGPLVDFIDMRARKHVECGTRFGMQSIIEDIRWYRPTDGKGCDAAINNSWVSILTRLLIERMPEVAPLIECRRSKYDRVFELRASHAAR